MSMLPPPPTTTQISIPFAFPVHKILNGHDLILYTVFPLPGPLSMGYSYYDWPSLDFKSASPEAISYPMASYGCNVSFALSLVLPIEQKHFHCIILSIAQGTLCAINEHSIETTLMCLYTLTIKSRPKLGG